MAHDFGKLCFWRKQSNQKGETSLIESFLYPKFGPGQLWETVGEEAEKLGVKILRCHNLKSLVLEGNKIIGAEVENLESGAEFSLEAEHVISTTSVKELIEKIKGVVPEDVREVASGLVYRDFMTVGVLLEKLKLKSKTMNTTVGKHGIVLDNWIYVQETDVKVGRLQLFNNWSPYLVADRNKVWIGMEYFVNEGDDLWNAEDEKFCDFAVNELEQIGVIEKEDVLDTTVFRIQKAYPAYLGTYGKFSIVREWTDTVGNMYLIGRNGMHRYNNMDHSMLSAMEAVQCIIDQKTDKSTIWSVNTEKEYHESK